MSEPIRIRRSRAKGWRMPENTVYVGRGSIWGNPFVVGSQSGIFDGKDGRPLGLCDQPEILIAKLTAEKAIDLYRSMVRGLVSPEMYPFGHEWTASMHKTYGGHASEIARSFLRGKNLACWCPLTDKNGNRVPCHADVLLEIANG